jgi:hypothetical protein
MLIRTWCDLQWGVPCAARTALPPAVYEFHLEFGALSAHAIIGLRIEGPSATKCLPSRPVHVLRSRQPGDVGKGRQYEIAYSSANDVQLLRQLEQTLGLPSAFSNQPLQDLDAEQREWKHVPIAVDDLLVVTAQVVQNKRHLDNVYA